MFPAVASYATVDKNWRTRKKEKNIEHDKGTI